MHRARLLLRRALQIAVWVILLGGLLAGCASTRFNVTGQALPRPLCDVHGPTVSAQVYWAAQWRDNQKEPQLREAMAASGIRAALAEIPCLHVQGLEQVTAAELTAPATAWLEAARTHATLPDRMVLIGVRELGPTLEIGIPVIVRGGTEVRLDVRVIDVPAGQSLADGQAYWRNGGPWVIKGIKTLESDMAAALRRSLGM